MLLLGKNVLNVDSVAIGVIYFFRVHSESCVGIGNIYIYIYIYSHTPLNIHIDWCRSNTAISFLCSSARRAVIVIILYDLKHEVGTPIIIYYTIYLSIGGLMAIIFCRRRRFNVRTSKETRTYRYTHTHTCMYINMNYFFVGIPKLDCTMYTRWPLLHFAVYRYTAVYVVVYATNNKIYNIIY